VVASGAVTAGRLPVGYQLVVWIAIGTAITGVFEITPIRL
jgi:hypothetical protein